MTSIENIIDSFIAENELDSEIKEPIIDLINQCMNGICRQILSDKIPETPVAAVTKTKSQKVLKADKIEDPSAVESREELHNCTTGILNQFCKDSGLKVGGNKAVIIDRVWRHLQGTSSDEDKSSRSKTKVNKKVSEKHACSGCNSKGIPCGVAGTEQVEDNWFCWRHRDDAVEFLKKTPSEIEPEIETKVVVKPKVLKKTQAKVGSEVESENESEVVVKPTKPKETKVAKKVTKASFVAAELMTDEE